MDIDDLQVNGCSVVEHDNIANIQQRLLDIRFELLGEYSQEQIEVQQDTLRELGRQVLAEEGIPEVFFIKASSFETGSGESQVEDPDEIFLVGLEVVRRVPDFDCCGLLVFGRNVRCDLVPDEVTMDCLCKSSSTLFKYVIPQDSKVVELVVQPDCVYMTVTCPAVIKDFVMRAGFYTDCIDPELRYPFIISE